MNPLQGILETRSAGKPGATRPLWLIATGLLGLAELQGCAGSQAAAASNDQVVELRAEIQALRDAQTASKQEHAAQLLAMADALQLRLQAVEEHLSALRLQLGHQEPDNGVALAMADNSDQRARGQDAKSPPKRPRRKRAPKVEPTPPVVSEAEEVRTLMASVAAQLQEASEEGSRVSAAQRAQAQDHLVKADRAAAQELWVRARELALDAQRLLEGAAADRARAKAPGDIEALQRDAEKLFPGRVKAVGDGLAVSLPLRRGGQSDLLVDRQYLTHIGRLAKVYDGMRLTIQFREPEPDGNRAVKTFDAIRRQLMQYSNVPAGRIEAATPLTMSGAVERGGIGNLVIGFNAS